MSITNFEDLLRKLNRLPTKPGRILAFDPGETTGWCQVDIEFVQDLPCIHFTSGQCITKTIEDGASFFLNQVVTADTYETLVIVCEDYRVYGYKSDQHKWAHLHTPQMIGCLKALCSMRNLPPPIMQMAGEAKDFCTDDKLHDWGIYNKGRVHARDAVRHAASYMLFSKTYPKDFS